MPCLRVSQQAPWQFFGLSRVLLRLEGAKKKRKKKECTHGCCQWSPARCLSWGGCQLTWKLRSPQCRAAEWPSGAARWWATPSMLPGLVAAANCSRSPPLPGATVRTPRLYNGSTYRYSYILKGSVTTLKCAKINANLLIVFLKSTAAPQPLKTSGRTINRSADYSRRYLAFWHNWDQLKQVFTHLFVQGNAKCCCLFSLFIQVIFNV